MEYMKVKKKYMCHESRTIVDIVKTIQFISGIGEGAPSPVILAKECSVARSCQVRIRCPISD